MNAFTIPKTVTTHLTMQVLILLELEPYCCVRSLDVTLRAPRVTSHRSHGVNIDSEHKIQPLKNHETLSVF